MNETVARSPLLYRLNYVHSDTMGVLFDMEVSRVCRRVMGPLQQRYMARHKVKFDHFRAQSVADR